MNKKTIIVIGAFDTKNTELAFLAERISDLGGDVVTMDVSVLGDPEQPTDISKHDVAGAAGSTIDQVIQAGDENKAFRIMSLGAARLVADAYVKKNSVLGGTMGTDLALDCTQALPLGVPKYIVSTVAFSPLIPPNRLAADVQMILWAGGLFGMNPICRSSLLQAAGAVFGATIAAEIPSGKKPLIGMTSLGSSCLSYMKVLKPALEQRGFDVAIFHSTRMGGMAFERLAGDGAFACVM